MNLFATKFRKIPKGFDLNNQEFVKRFWSHVEDISFLVDEDCWNWIGGKSKDGYGRIKILHVMYYANRISYHLYKRDLDENLLVCHKCDNPSCINPSHLYQDNDKGNQNTGRVIKPSYKGENNHASKLTNVQVLEIKELLKNKLIKQIEIAKNFNVSKATISRIKYS